ncbi:hypothetical protein GpartN1_g5348.t1 [Galdieria partita]|uniref:Uncharacterized protein n=1 Tax=Galdieria partita TaxID=83374 RepID=A0A9C7PSJ0_9RHOD|nr:hypothetical protein GpartN1_g807.t1 [Galdieria partita]GJQ13557.1 hypothetical protein GpartN1_g5348.t1 [Galdieria partita]
MNELPSFESGNYKFLNGAPLKHVIHFCIKKKVLDLAFAIRRFMMQLKPRNMLVVDEHNALWGEFGNKTNRWPDFFQFYTDFEVMSTPYCGILTAGSQHYQFEDNLPSGYADIKQYLERLSFKEFDLWQELPDYPSILREHSEEVVELTGLVPRMIAKMVFLANDIPYVKFENLKTYFTSECFPEMKKSHTTYVRSLSYKEARDDFYTMLYKLFMHWKVPNVIIADEAYRIEVYWWL